MNQQNRKFLDLSTLSAGYFTFFILFSFLILILSPILIKGSGAFLFQATVEHRRLQAEIFNAYSREKLETELKEQRKALAPLLTMMKKFEEELSGFDLEKRRQLRQEYKEFKERLAELIGPFEENVAVLTRMQYGKTRWDQAKEKLAEVLNSYYWDYSSQGFGQKKSRPRADFFKNTELYPAFAYLNDNLKKIMLPRLTFYWQFFTQESVDIHFFGGIKAELLGTVYLTILAVFFAVPIGIISAIYLVEFARQQKIVSLIRIFVSTLAGVPSIVFGLFGLAFFINKIKISGGKSVLAGGLTLALLILPTIIRASEEALKAVPLTYKEAALAVGATHLRTVFTVIIPAALPGIISGIIISLARAAGETAPIIFTAAVSVGQALKFWEIFSQPTPALSWNIYNLSTEHEAVDQIRHVQFGMVLTLIAIIFILNFSAIIIRARINKKLYH